MFTYTVFISIIIHQDNAQDIYYYHGFENMFVSYEFENNSDLRL